MSAYTQAPRPAPVIPMTEARSIPKMVEELEHFFSIARQWEAQLRTEREQSRRLQGENAALAREVARLESEMENARTGQEQLQRREKTLKDQINDQARQMDRLRSDIERARSETHEERRKQELENEIHRSQLETIKRRDELSRSEYAQMQRQLAAAQDQITQLRAYAERARAGWQEMQKASHKANLILSDYERARSSAEGASAQLEAERRRREDLDQAIAKERRDKQIALNCLKTAEDRISQLEKELETLRDKVILASAPDSSVQIRF